jgi:Ca2+-binding RTX toxin-like protein
MARITVKNGYSFSLSKLSLQRIFTADDTDVTSTSMKADYGNGSYDLVKGRGFTYGFLDVPKGGTVTAFQAVQSGKAMYELTGMSMSVKSFTAVVKTKSKSDDQALYKSILSKSDVIKGHNGADILAGFGGNDTLAGGRGNDKLDGGIGNDRLTGDAGKDAFLFTSTLNAKSNVDSISGFSVRDDTIHLENRIFKQMKKTGTLSKDFFTVGSQAKDGNDYVVYDKAKGALYYDADGSGAGNAILFAKLKASITHKDFLVI